MNRPYSNLLRDATSSSSSSGPQSVSVEDAADPPHVKTVQSHLLFCVCCPCLAAVQQSADDAGIVYCLFGRDCELRVVSDTCGELAKCCCGLPDALINLSFEG